MRAAKNETQQRVVILGGGFGGLNAARSLGGDARFAVTLIDSHNHYTFQPLLYQVATAALGEQEIADPLRGLLSKHKNVRVLQATALAVDVEARRVRTTHGEFSYDYLLVACGVQNSYFGHEQWERWAPGLKTLSQAREIRARILGAFEVAAHDVDPQTRRRFLTFVVVGGGATGVELAGAIATITRQTLTEELRGFDPTMGRVVLVEAAARLLTTFDAGLAERARRDLVAVGVDVRLNTQVVEVGETYVDLGGERIPAGVIIWTAGVCGVPLGATLDAALDRRGCVVVREDCTIAGHHEVFVIGDLAVCRHHGTGRPLGQVANVAAQQGRYFARTLQRDLVGKPRVPFRYFDKGQMATIGVFRALCEAGPVKFGGLAAWLVWIVIHIHYLSSMRNRFFVLLRWIWSLVTMAHHARVIVPPAWQTYERRGDES
jgi:NADH dehydrogenase